MPSLPVSPEFQVARPPELGHSLNKNSGRGTVGAQGRNGEAWVSVSRDTPTVRQAPGGQGS